MARDYVTIRGEDRDGRTIWRETSVGPIDVKSVTARALKLTDGTIRFTGAGRVVQTSVSIGLVGDAEGLVSVKEVMKAADVACYMAKKKGRNRVHRFRYDDEELSQTHAQMAWVSDIKAALQTAQDQVKQSLGG